MDADYIAVLEYLSKFNVGVHVDALPFLKKHFKNKPISHMHALVEMMKINGHVTFNSNNIIKHINLLPMALTLEGRNFLSDFILKDANLKHLKKQPFNNNITWAIAVISFLWSIGMGIYSTIQNTNLSQRLDYTQREVKQLRISLHTLDSLYKPTYNKSKNP